jgi:hypothetical protein
LIDSPTTVVLLHHNVQAWTSKPIPVVSARCTVILSFLIFLFGIIKLWRCGGIGRHDGLPNHCSAGHVGSNPTTATTFIKKQLNSVILSCSSSDYCYFVLPCQPKSRVFYRKMRIFPNTFHNFSDFSLTFFLTCDSSAKNRVLLKLQLCSESIAWKPAQYGLHRTNCF